MSAHCELTYKTPLPMLQRAMISWANPHVPRRQRSLLLRLVGVYSILVGVLFSDMAILGSATDMLAIGMFVGQDHAKYLADGVEIVTDLDSMRSTWAAHYQDVILDDAAALRVGQTIQLMPHVVLQEAVDAATKNWMETSR